MVAKAHSDIIDFARDSKVTSFNVQVEIHLCP